MNATEEYEDEIRENYERLAQIPTVIGAYLRANGIVRSTWSQRSIARGKTFKFVKDIFVSNLKKVAESLPLDISTEALSKTSSSEKFRAVIRKNDNKHYLEIWQDDSIIRFVDFTTFNLHGPVYTDGK
ncbi:acylamino-acid-releasing enzyme-like [Anoplophora glabripennis]|uniref:acylamino-acid-releasing enzyme-like n=1 Tax=Anoplophora glabripennis TaxID=217634 RepID=UPI000C75EE45|nr:acylamino-acid-releasing enzyme-like [Anoplophora glabripennis]